MLTDVVPFLACPHCRGGLVVDGGSLRCASNHVFDIARHGYVSLLPGDAQTGTADTAEMVAARHAFLAAGHFGAVADALAKCAAGAVGTSGDGCVVDVGAGTGHYLSAVLEQLPGSTGVAVDLSKHAARRAARAHPRAGAVVADAWRALPLHDGVAAVALSVFAPRNAAELSRVLRPDGALLVVTPTPRHLAELVDALDLLTVDADKARRLHDQLGGDFLHSGDELIETPLHLSRADVQAVVMMGPNAFHSDPVELAERVAALGESVDATLSVTLSVYRPR